MVYTLTPGPVPLHEDTLKAMSKQIISHRSESFRVLLASVRSRLQEIYDSTPLVLTGSGTLAVESMAWSLVEPGEKVLVVSHGEFGERLSSTLQRRGAIVKEVTPATPGSPVRIEEVEEEIEKGNHTVLATVFTETSLGLSFRDVERIGEKAKERGMLVIVDAVSALGGENIPPPDVIDALATASQKALAGPPGLSFVFVNEEAKKKLASLKTKPPSYLDLYKVLRYHEERRETPYTPAINLLYAMNIALELIIEYGVDEWVERHCKRAQLLHDRLPAQGYKPVVQEERYRACTLAAFYTPLSSSKIVEKALAHGYHIARGMGELRDRVIRVSTMGWLNDSIYLELVDVLASILNHNNQS
ncbi:MAG: hypothetical protein DSY37_00045 [Hyperthermus sp.]|nr:MAG: hypothetical protein DSY37_00045 [Hyperthermus sp.]